jgi:hypothetical protein
MPDIDEINRWKRHWGYAAALIDSGAPRRTAPETLPLPTDKGTSSKRGFAKDDTSVQYVSRPSRDAEFASLLEKPLAQSILGRLRDRWALDRTAANDQITGIAYTRQRQSALAELVGSEDHYLVREYGMRTITDLNPVGQRSGIRIDHDKSSPYMRDELDLDTRADKPVESTFSTLYAACKKADWPDYDKDKMVFVNSPTTKDKLTAIYGPSWTPPDGTAANNVLADNMFETLEVKPGFYALAFEKPLTEGQRKALTGNMIPGVGATPSTYQAVKELAQIQAPVPAPLTDEKLKDEKLDNIAKLSGIADAKGLQTLESLPQDHPMKTIAGATVKMVTGLQQALAKLQDEKAEALKHNKLIGAALTNIEQLMEAMPTYMDDIPRFSRLFDVLVDEVYLALATAKPYTLDNYKEASKTAIERRAPTLKTMEGVQTSTFLLSSGMDTLASALVAAKAALGDKAEKIDLMAKESKSRTRGANYFEVQFNMLGEQTLASDSPLIMGTLNPSTPTRKMREGVEGDWSADTLIEGITMRINKEDTPATPENPVVAVLDITVEKGVTDQPPELERILSTFKTEIASGALQLVLCKSYQKFPSLGSGKAMAGGVTVIGKGDSAVCKELVKSLAKSETDENVINNDEAQLVSHFTEHEEAMEQPMLARAAKNAGFIRDLLPETVGGNKNLKFLYAKDLPFVAIPDEKFKFSAGSGDGAAPESRPDDLLHSLGVENRFSFGFQNTSCLPFPEGVRIAAGQESEGELMEKLFTVMKIVNPATPKPITPEAIGGLARQAADEACTELEGVLFQEGTDPDKAAGRRRKLVATLRGSGVLTEAQAENLLATSTDPTVADATLKQLIKSLHDKDAAPPKGYGVPSDEIAAAYNDVASTLRAGRKPDVGENAAWRKDVANQLLRAGAIQATDLVMTETGVASLLGLTDGEKIDDKLIELIEGLHSKSEVTIGDRTYTPGELADIQGSMALAAVYKDAATKLCAGRKSKPGENKEWRESVVRRLLKAEVLKETEVTYKDDVVAGVLKANSAKAIDDLLVKLLNDLDAGAETQIGDRTVTPEQVADLQRKMTGPGKKLVPDDKGLEVQLALVARFTGTVIDDILSDTELAAAYNGVASKLLKDCKPEAGENGKWRLDTAGQLVSAGALAETDVGKTGNDVTTLCGETESARIDEKLTALIKGLHSRSAVTIGDRTYTPKQLAGIHRKMTSKRDEDVNRMHAKAKRGWQLDDGSDLAPQGKSAAYLPNIVACCALTNDALFKDPSNAKAFTELADPLIKRGLDKLSPEAQQRLLRKRAEAAIKGGCADPTKDTSVGDAVATIENVVGKQPYREGGANILKGGELAAALNAWPTPVEQKDIEVQDAQLKKIVAACTRRLDLQSELELVTSLVDSVTELRKLKAGTTSKIEALETQLIDLTAQKRDLEHQKQTLKEGIETKTMTFKEETAVVAEFRGKLRKLNEEVGQLFSEKKNEDGGKKKAEAETMKQAIEAAETDGRKMIAECEAEIGEVDKAIAAARSEVDPLKEAIMPLESHRRLAGVLCRQLEDKVAKIDPVEAPLKATKLGGIPLAGKTDPQRMEPQELKTLKEGVKQARVAVTELNG